MDSSIIGKIDKARKYAEETERVSITSFAATFQGNHNSYDVTFNAGNWECECHFFVTRDVCSHTMALQRMLDDFLAKVASDAQATEVQ